MTRYDTGPLSRSGPPTGESQTDTTDTVDSDPAGRTVDRPAESNEASSVLIADGGETIRKRKEIQHTDAEVRTYAADGTLYAYREGDDHVVVSRGNEPGDWWEKRVPATRTDVAEGDTIWTIPDNWSLNIKITGPAETEYAIYTIPETGDDILVSVPNKCHLVDAWYLVKTVGELRFEFDGTLNRSRVSDRIAEFEARDDISEALIEGLRAVDQQWETFEREYLDEFHMWAGEAVWQVMPEDENYRLDGWSIDPWSDIFGVTGIITNALDVDDDIAAEVSEVLLESGAIEPYPDVRVAVDTE